MKKEIWIKILCMLVCVLIALAGFGIYLLASLRQSMTTIAQEFTQLESNDGSLAIENGDLGAFYQMIAGKMETCGGMEAAQQEIGPICDAIVKQSFSGLSVENVQCEPDRIVLYVSGTAVGLDQYNAQLLGKAVTASALDYLRSNFFDAAAALLSSGDAVEAQVYGRFAPQLLAALASQIEQAPEEQVSYTVELKLVDGSWQVSASQNP